MIIKESEPVGPVSHVILGFPGVGMVGSIASEFIVHKLGFKEIGHIRSEKLPALAIIRKSRPESPIRIYKKDKILALISDIMIPSNLSHEFAGKIAEWLESQKPEEIILLGGSKKKTSNGKTYVVSWKTEYLDAVGLDQMKLGFVAGIYGPLMLEFMDRNLKGYMVMAEAEGNPDTGAAARIIRHLSDRMELDIDPSKLEKAGQKKKVEGPTWDPYPSIYG